MKVKCTKFLGVSIDSDIKLSSHINGVLKNTSKIIGIMGKLQGQLPKKILLLLYNSLILPHLSYCNVIWGACSKHLTNHILLLQKRAVRVICNQSYLSHTKPLCTKLNIFTL